MCDLLGLSFNMPVCPTLTFEFYKKRANSNPDGWGIALYPNEERATQVIKEPVNANESSLAEYITKSNNFHSKIYIAHVRKLSRGGPAYKNTHPFSREYNRIDYCFTHNGTLKGSFKQNMAINRFKPIGETDSEYAFCHLMNFFENNENCRDSTFFKKIHKKLQKINTYGKFNCMFSDGEYLFCYYDKNEHNGLYYTHKNFTSHEKTNRSGYIIASNPLSDEKWVKFTPGELIIFTDGDICYSNSGE